MTDEKRPPYVHPNPVVSTRVEPRTKSMLQELGAAYPDADGRPGAVSAVLRKFIDACLPKHYKEKLGKKAAP